MDTAILSSTTGKNPISPEENNAPYTVGAFSCEWTQKYIRQTERALVLRSVAEHLSDLPFDTDRDEGCFVLSRMADHLFDRNAAVVYFDVFEREDVIVFELSSDENSVECSEVDPPPFTSIYIALGVLADKYQSAVSLEEGERSTERICVCFEYVDVGTIGFKSSLA